MTAPGTEAAIDGTETGTAPSLSSMEVTILCTSLSEIEGYMKMRVPFELRMRGGEFF
jgi:hypothetical protein